MPFLEELKNARPITVFFVLKTERIENWASLSEQQTSFKYFMDHVLSEDEVRITVNLDDFEKAIQTLVPSVSFEELARYTSLKEGF